MNIGKATGIFRNIDNAAVSDAEKIEAINEVVAMETHNSITKMHVLAALNWAMRSCFFLECKNTTKLVMLNNGKEIYTGCKNCGIAITDFGEEQHFKFCPECGARFTRG